MHCVCDYAHMHSLIAMNRFQCVYCQYINTNCFILRRSRKKQYEPSAADSHYSTVYTKQSDSNDGAIATVTLAHQQG